MCDARAVGWCVSGGSLRLMSGRGSMCLGVLRVHTAHGTSWGVRDGSLRLMSGRGCVAMGALGARGAVGASWGGSGGNLRLMSGRGCVGLEAPKLCRSCVIGVCTIVGVGRRALLG